MKEKSLAKNTVYYLIYNTLNILFPFISGIYVSRTLLQVNVGEVAYAQNITMYFVTFAYLGIPTYGMREIAKIRSDQVKVRKLFSELCIINAVSTVIFSMIYFLMIFSIPQFRNNCLLYLISGGSLILNIFNISWLYEGLEDFGFISIRNLIFKSISFLLLILFVKDENDSLFYAAIHVIGTAGNYILNALYAPRFVKFTKQNLSFKKHLKPILNLAGVYLAIEIYTLVDITMLGNISGKMNVAIYSYASRIHKLLLQVLNSFTVVIVPRMALYYKEHNYTEFNKIISNVFKILLLISIPMIVGIYFVSDGMISLLYGFDYINSSSVLKILSLMILISPIGYLLGSRVLLVTGNESKMLQVVILGAIVNVIGNIILINAFDEYGAALASLISEIVVMVTYIIISKKYFKLRGILLDAIKIVIGASIMGVVLLICREILANPVICLIVSIIVAIVVYFCSLLVLKEDIVVSNAKKIYRKIFARKSDGVV